MTCAEHTCEGAAADIQVLKVWQCICHVPLCQIAHQARIVAHVKDSQGSIARLTGNPFCITKLSFSCLVWAVGLLAT